MADLGPYNTNKTLNCKLAFSSGKYICGLFSSVISCAYPSSTLFLAQTTITRTECSPGSLRLYMCSVLPTLCILFVLPRLNSKFHLLYQNPLNYNSQTWCTSHCRWIISQKNKSERKNFTSSKKLSWHSLPSRSPILPQKVWPWSLAVPESGSELPMSPGAKGRAVSASGYNPDGLFPPLPTPHSSSCILSCRHNFSLLGVLFTTELLWVRRHF